ncbi:MAG TPA: hypothetical protein H9954_07620 [Candidatus Phascolarctobacterium stercoravium]|nr:hypothetical protein [Candidatus Phascolarctobacterium stercoravium]
MSNGERIIVKLDPDYNPTGKPMPDEMLEQMKADPDFAKLSEVEQQMVTAKMKKLVQKPEDLVQYGTLKQKIEKCALMKKFEDSKDGSHYIALHLDEDDSFDGTKRIVEGCTISAGATVLNLMAMGKVLKKEYQSGIVGFGAKAAGGKKYNILRFCVADIKAPITGKVFSLCEIKNSCIKALWDSDLFIVSSIPDDTRSAAIKWYKETTGKEPRYKTPEDIQEEEAAQKANVDSFLSKWDL